MNGSLTIADHIVNTNYDDIPAQVIEVTKKSLLDGLGTMMAASGLSEECRPFIELALENGGKKESTIIGHITRVPASMAAFANGSLSHVLDFEDYGAGVHANAASIPAALAMAEATGKVSGKELITALTLGSDIVFRLSLARKPDNDSVKAGWYMPPILGAMGAAAAAGKLLHLNAQQLLDAFSSTMCQATFSIEIGSPKSVIRGVREAFAAKAGVIGALLAKKGVIGFDQPFESKGGFFTMYTRGNYNPEVLVKNLGKVFEGASAGFKPWPACAFTHPYIEEALQIAQSNDINPDDIDEIRIVVDNGSAMVWDPIDAKRKPVTSPGAKFSIPFVVATAFVCKKVTLAHFLPQALNNPTVLALAQKVNYDIVQNVAGSSRGLIQVKTNQGILDSKRVKYVYGDPLNPMSREALIEKFRDCASHSARKLSQKRLENLIELIMHIEKVNDIKEITAYI